MRGGTAGESGRQSSSSSASPDTARYLLGRQLTGCSLATTRLRTFISVECIVRRCLLCHLTVLGAKEEVLAVLPCCPWLPRIWVMVARSTAAWPRNSSLLALSLHTCDA